MSTKCGVAVGIYRHFDPCDFHLWPLEHEVNPSQTGNAKDSSCVANLVTPDTSVFDLIARRRHRRRSIAWIETSKQLSMSRAGLCRLTETVAQRIDFSTRTWRAFCTCSPYIRRCAHPVVYVCEIAWTFLKTYATCNSVLQYRVEWWPCSQPWEIQLAPISLFGLLCHYKTSANATAVDIRI